MIEIQSKVSSKPSLPSMACEVFEQSLAGVFQKFDDELEVLGTAIVGVRHDIVHGMVPEETGHADDFM